MTRRVRRKSCIYADGVETTFKVRDAERYAEMQSFLKTTYDILPFVRDLPDKGVVIDYYNLDDDQVEALNAFSKEAKKRKARQSRGPRKPMATIMVDVEADGPIPGDYSMVALGAIVVEESLDRTFYGQLKPVSESWVPAALAVSGYSREETLAFDDPKTVMETFHHFTGANPFGHSSANLGSLYKGLVRDASQTFKKLRKTKHTHHPVDDAKGNAEALLAMRAMGLKIRL